MSVAFRLALILSCCLSNFRSSLRWYCSFLPLIMTLQSESVRNLHFQEFLYTTRYFLVFQDGINAESVVTIKQTCLVFICFRHYQHRAYLMNILLDTLNYISTLLLSSGLIFIFLFRFKNNYCRFLFTQFNHFVQNQRGLLRFKS